jgi:PAS domain S-box-containing protein
VQDKVRGFEAGGVDYITKPFQESEVLARVRTHMDLRNMQLNLERMVAKRTAEVIESEQRFRATFEQAAVGIAHVSPEGRFLRINKKFCDIVGYSEDEMLALTFQDITHPDDLDADLASVRQVLKGETETYSMDKRYYRKDGSIVWVNLIVSLLSDRGGSPNYFVSVIKDISDRKQAEEALHQSRDFLEHLIAAVPDAIYSIKIPERTINWANDSFNVIGYEPEEYIGQTTKKYYANSEDYDAVGHLQQDAIRKGDDMIRTEIMVLRKDGRVIPAELTATYYREEGKLSQITALVRDISERKQAEEKLAKSEAKYRSLVDNSIVGVFATTTDGRFTFVNDAMARMFDFDSKEQMIAKGSLERWKDPKDRERVLAELQKHGSVTNFEAETITHSDRHIHVLFSAKQVGKNIFGMMMDISDRKQAEIELKEAYTEIEQLQIQLQAESAYLQETGA